MFLKRRGNFVTWYAFLPTHFWRPGWTTVVPKNQQQRAQKRDANTKSRRNAHPMFLIRQARNRRCNQTKETKPTPMPTQRTLTLGSCTYTFSVRSSYQGTRVHILECMPGALLPSFSLCLVSFCALTNGEAFPSLVFVASRFCCCTSFFAQSRKHF